MLNVSRHIVAAIRDVCDRVLEEHGKCGSEDDFVMAVNWHGEWKFGLDCYSEQGDPIPYALMDANQCVRKVGDYLANGVDIVELVNNIDSPRLEESPLRWPDGEEMRTPPDAAETVYEDDDSPDAQYATMPTAYVDPLLAAAMRQLIAARDRLRQLEADLEYQRKCVDDAVNQIASVATKQEPQTES